MSIRNQRSWNRQVRDYLNELEARQIFGGTGGTTTTEPISPDFTYDINGNLTQIDYAGGEQKVFTYNGNGDLQYLDFIKDGTTWRKEFFYVGDQLDYITEGYI
jgi:hypothetical protein